MTTHLLVEAIKRTQKVVRSFRNDPSSKLILHYGVYAQDEKKQVHFFPGVTPLHFENLYWFLTTYNKWTQVDLFHHHNHTMVEFYWTDPVALAAVQQFQNEVDQQSVSSTQKQSAAGAKKKKAALPTLPLASAAPLKKEETKSEATTPLKYVKGVYDDEYREEGICYQENRGSTTYEQADLLCRERPYSFQISTRHDRPLPSSVAQVLHKYPVSHISLKRHATFYFKNLYAYHFTVAQTGILTKQKVIAEGVPSCHISIERLHNEEDQDQNKPDFDMAGDLLEKGMDILQKKIGTYSLQVLASPVTAPTPTSESASSSKKLTQEWGCLPHEWIPYAISLPF